MRLSRDAEDVAKALALRERCFGTNDADSFDTTCDHVLIESRAGLVVACFRLLWLDGARIGTGYAARSYDLSALSGLPGPILEIGRFCVDPACRDADVLRLAWAAITTLVDREHVRLLIGCTSFSGIDPKPYRDCFALLHARHLGPHDRRPAAVAAEVVSFGTLAHAPFDAQRATRMMPPLLRSYLAMGGWVGDHAVVDRQMNTLHVFTAVEVAAIPEARKRLLRALV
ncbi:GNAT family N-acyltransferase [Sulfitobacter sp. D35]|uniref:GNAT family N-acetyltransferase n=1 Tax=Sulfitobacter sp. D35 TaxID=3083252 RepID=UPI00296FD51D|nr:GNAT family N-acyltransferase [Sulfitobacter sp. D35]MDW4497590.1 GNAT family N-acyltransferase [Sulfitobacter sp. D35]